MLLNKLISMAVLRSNELFTIDEDKELLLKKDSSFVNRIRSLSTPDVNPPRGTCRRTRSFSTQMDSREEPKTVIEFKKMINDINASLGLGKLKS
jgi:hypothetical protein